MNYHAHPGFHTASTLARNQYSDVQSHHVSVGEMEPAGDAADLNTGESGTRVSRRLSKRAMENAPDGIVGGNVFTSSIST